MFDMLGKMGEMKARMEEAQKAVSLVSVTRHSASGLVTATASGDKRLQSLSIDATLLRTEPTDRIQALLVETINDALAEAERQSAEIIKQKTAGLLPNIPGLDLSKFGK